MPETETEYCSRCGSATEWHEIEGRRRRVCPVCSHIAYKNPIVAAGTLSEQDDRVLLIRRGVEPGIGQWGLPAGYGEIGESPEETAIRETREETGLDVALDGLLGVFAFGGGSAQSGVVILYAAHPTNGALAAGDDAIDVAFFAANTLPDQIAFPIHRHVLKQWAQAHSITYRMATKNDWDRLAAIAAQDHRDRPMAFPDPTHEWVVLALHQEEVIGFASLIESALEYRRLTHWYVMPNWRNRGIGRRLLSEARAMVTQQGTLTLQVEMAANNSMGLALLLRHGFAIQGFSDLVRDDDAAPLRINLSSPAQALANENK